MYPTPSQDPMAPAVRRTQPAAAGEETTNVTSGAVETKMLIPVLTKAEKDAFVKCHFCKRMPNVEEKKAKRCSTCKVALELKEVRWTAKRIAVTVVVSLLVLLLTGGVVVGIYAAATKTMRTMPKWTGEEWCEDENAECSFYQMGEWDPWGQWSSGCSPVQTRKRTREVFAEGKCCPATTMTMNRSGAPCCKDGFSAMVSNDYVFGVEGDYCYKKLEPAGFLSLKHKCQEQEGSLAIPINQTQAREFNGMVDVGDKSYWIGLKVSVSEDGQVTSVILLDQQRIEEAENDERFGYARWNFNRTAMKPGTFYGLAGAANRMVMRPYDKCAEEEPKFRCDVYRDKEAWLFTHDDSKPLPAFCKKFFSNSPESSEEAAESI